METRQVLLICLQPLLSEGLRRIVQKMDDVELVEPPCLDLENLESILSLGQPDAILVAGEQDDERAGRLIALLLNHCEEVPIIWVGLEDSSLHVYSSRILPANSDRLQEVVRQIPSRQTGRKKIPRNRFGGDNYAI
jgi:hypothetical protein